MKKTILTIMLATLMSLSYSQEKVSIQVIQDAKLLFAGDDKHGYDAGTLDIGISLIMQGDQQKYGYMIVYPEFEYADLKIDPYRRWTANIGYVFNELIVKNSEIGFSISYGFIDRGLTEFCWGANAFAKYRLCDNAKIILNLQGTERPDLDVIYNTPNEIRFSGFVGLEFSIFNK
jgi:hypothetical protein